MRASVRAAMVLAMRMSDRQLLERLAAGDEEAFTPLFLRHRRWLEARARRWLSGSGRDADDVLQDVYMRASAQLARGAMPDNLEAWLSTLVRNACMDEQRAARVRLRRHADEPTLATVAGGPEPLERVVAREQLTGLVEDVRRLPARQRRVLELALEGASHQEIADRLDCTVLTTRSLLMRARENLRLSADARQTPCGEIRRALDHAARRRRRAPEVVRRHLWSCSACARYGEHARRRHGKGIRDHVAAVVGRRRAYPQALPVSPGGDSSQRFRPSPPSWWSRPGPPARRSSPGPPESTSQPWPPSRRSAPSPP
jgi:RNA polymerase sigma-70 factor (ECF subfamily)